MPNRISAADLINGADIEYLDDRLVNMGFFLKMPRIVHGLTLTQVAKQIDRSPSWLWKVESNHLAISVLEFQTVVMALHLLAETGQGKGVPIHKARSESAEGA